MDLSTNYLGLKLRTPLVPSASPLSEEVDHIKEMEDAGAAAVVLHSLFEEQTEGGHAEAQSPFRIDPETYLKHIAEAKRCVKIPIIASLNCTALGGWLGYARQITEAGADAHLQNTDANQGHRFDHRERIHRHRAFSARGHKHTARG